MLNIRSNIVYVIFIIFYYAFNFNNFHYKTIKRIFKYLRDTLHFKFIYKKKLVLLREYINVD